VSAADRVRGHVTFSKLTKISNIPGDNRSADILVDGVVVGELVANMINVDPTGRGTYRVGSYSIELEDGPDESHSVDFSTTHVRRRGMSPPEALSEAKSYVREFYDPSPNREAKRAEVEAMAAATGFELTRDDNRIHQRNTFLARDDGRAVLLHTGPVYTKSVAQWAKAIAHAARKLEALS
jgi:hypothetical protein